MLIWRCKWTVFPGEVKAIVKVSFSCWPSLLTSRFPSQSPSREYHRTAQLMICPGWFGWWIFAWRHQGITCIKVYQVSLLQWRHNGRDGVSNHQPHHCLLNGLFRRRSKKHQCSASLAFVTGEFPAQMASNAENVSIWLRHHGDAIWHRQRQIIKG